MIAPAITISHAQLCYGNEIVFNNLTCHLPAGRTTCLLGASGVGKTSLLRLIANLHPIDTATTQSAQITASDNQSLQHRIAYLGQTDLLLPWLTCLDNVLLGLQLRGEHSHSKQHLKRAKLLLVEMGLADAFYKVPAQLSGGMRQRVALARTLMEDRPVVLMDEPFSALDTLTRLKLQELAADFLRNRTVLLITHDPLEALRLGHHVLIMAGQPAQITSIINPTGAPPRSLADPDLLIEQGQLMRYLLNTQEASI